MIHEISCEAGNFADIIAGRKSFVLQKETDAQYNVGDFLALNEIIDVEGTEGAVDWTGRCCLVKITHMYGCLTRYLTDGTIILGIRPCVICPIGDDSWYTVETYGGTKGGAPA